MSLIHKDKKLDKREVVHVEDFMKNAVMPWAFMIFMVKYKELDWNRILANPALHHLDCEFFRPMTIARIAMPSSKRKSVELLDESWGSLKTSKVKEGLC